MIERIKGLLEGGKQIVTLPLARRHARWEAWRDEVEAALAGIEGWDPPALQLDRDAMLDDLKSLEEFLESVEKTGGDQVEVNPAPPKNTAEETEDDGEAVGAEATKDGGKIHVFLSYLSDDAAIADVVQQELMSISERVSVFKAHDDLRLAANWRRQLLEEIGKASFFLMINTDPEKDWQWPIFEATTFENMHLTGVKSGKQGEPETYRLCCLHDTESRPRPLEEFQSYQVTMFDSKSVGQDKNFDLEQKAFYERASLFNFLKKFIEYPEEPLRDLESFRDNLLASVRKIAEAFHGNRLHNVIREDYYPARIELSVAPESADRSVKQSIEEAGVFLGPIAERLFGLKKEELNWLEFKQHLIDENQGQEPLWISQVEEALTTAYGENIPEANTAVLYSRFSKRFYRPTLSRQLFYLGGGRRFIVVLVEEPPIDFNDQSQMGLLLAGLILGSRFRFQFIDPIPEQLNEHESEEDFSSLVRSINRRIQSIETEAAMHGLLDRDALVECYSDVDRDKISDLYDKWEKVRGELFGTIANWKENGTAFEETKESLRELVGQELLQLNRDFMKLTAKRYAELVSAKFDGGR